MDGSKQAPTPAGPVQEKAGGRSKRGEDLKGREGSASGCRQHRKRTTEEETPIGGLQTPKVAIIAERRAGGTSPPPPLLLTPLFTNGSKHTQCALCDVWLGG